MRGPLWAITSWSATVLFNSRYSLGAVAVIAAILLASAASCSRNSPGDGKTGASGTTGESAEAKQRGAAIAELTDAIARDPNKMNERGELAFVRRGKLYDDAGEAEKAAADYSQAIRLYPIVKPKYLNARLIEVYDARGRIYQKQRQYDKAIADYTEVIDRGSGSFADLGEAMAFGGFVAGDLVNRGVCFDEKGDHEKAVADFKKVEKIAPNLLNDDIKKRMAN